MILLHSPIQELLVAVESIVPEGTDIMIQFVPDHPGDELFGVALPEEGSEETAICILLWGGLNMVEIIRVLQTALAVGLSRDPGRGIRFCQWRDKIRAVYEELQRAVPE